MNTGIFGEGFPYSNFHDLNMDWIIKIAKDFLDQYTNIQQVISDGLEALQNTTDEGLESLENKTDEGLESLLEKTNDGLQALQNKKTELEALLQAWYDTHSADIANQLVDAVASFSTQATQIGQAVISSIPAEYADVTNSIKAILPNTRQFSYSSPWNYYYGSGYFDPNLDWQDSETVVTLRVPCKQYEAVILSCAVHMVDTVNPAYVFTYEMTDGTISRLIPTAHTYTETQTTGNYEMTAMGYPNTNYVFFTVKAASVGQITIATPMYVLASKNAWQYPFGIYRLDPNNAMTKQTYFDDTKIGMLSTSYAMWRCVKAGDIITDLVLAGSLTYYGSFKSGDDTVREKITTSTYVVPKNGIICIFINLAREDYPTFIPSNRIKLYERDLIESASADFSGLSGVAFGTSLTARSESSYGYLTTLEKLSNMTFDNQGISSAVLVDKQGYASIMNAITSYNDWADKSVCILEGFVNDWRQNPAKLGTWTDTSSDTLCGRVRSALNYIATQKQGITIFLVLDHYGRNYEGTDSSSTALNSNNQTQYEWWEEVAKVAESLGVTVIKQYAMSGIDELNPQYLTDNIHPSSLGAVQSGTAIWAEMKKRFANK